MSACVSCTSATLTHNLTHFQTMMPTVSCATAPCAPHCAPQSCPQPVLPTQAVLQLQYRQARAAKLQGRAKAEQLRQDLGHSIEHTQRRLDMEAAQPLAVQWGPQVPKAQEEQGSSPCLLEGGHHG